MTVLQEDTKAPDFTLRSSPEQEINLKDYKRRPLILVFYPADWSPVCSDQLSLYNELIPEFQKHHAGILGISVDSSWCHQAFSKERKLRFPLLSDFEPKGSISKLYGAYDDKKGTAERALFVIDKDGMIRWSYLSPPKVNPGADGILKALETLNP